MQYISFWIASIFFYFVIRQFSSLFFSVTSPQLLFLISSYHLFLLTITYLATFWNQINYGSRVFFWTIGKFCEMTNNINTNPIPFYFIVVFIYAISVSDKELSMEKPQLLWKYLKNFNCSCLDAQDVPSCYSIFIVSRSAYSFISRMNYYVLGVVLFSNIAL